MKTAFRFGLAVKPLSLSFCILLLGWLPAAGAFVHPGIYHNTADLAFMRAKIAAQEEPWYSAWLDLKNEDKGSLSWTPSPVAQWDANSNSYMDGDALAAYNHALQWALTGEAAHAAKAIEILNAWAWTLQRIYGDTSQEMVVWGWNGCHLANAAELLRYYTTPDGKTSGWAAADIAQFERMLNIGYEVIKDFMPTFNGNWDAGMMNTMLCTAIFINDQTMFDRAVNHFYGNYTVSAGLVKKGDLASYILSTGQCQESGRDQGHVQMGLGNYVSLCEAAWKQGVDLYGAYGNRLLLGFEYTSKYMLGNDDVPYTALPPNYWPVISPSKRGIYHPIYEAVYQHYVGRKGLQMPFTAQVVSNTACYLVFRQDTLGDYRPESSTPNAGICWGTLTMLKGPETDPLHPSLLFQLCGSK